MEKLASKQRYGGMLIPSIGFMMPDGNIFQPHMECVMQTLFPQIKPYARHELTVEEPHVLYFDESGSPDGMPVVFVHGGPGSGCDAKG